MYNVMIVDDDKPIRNRLKAIIPWNEMGLSFVCEAGDSDTAMELFKAHHPKIIIIDINIPIINGLELAEELANLDPEVCFIVITGYTNFEYVKDSVKLGAIDLISKPILEQEIRMSLQKAIDSFEMQRTQKIKSQFNQMLLKENLPMIRENYASLILREGIDYKSQDSSLIHSKLGTLGIDIKGKYYHGAIISPELDRSQYKDADLLLFSLKNISDEIMAESKFKLFSFYDSANYLNCMISSNFINSDNILEETIREIHEKLKFYFDLSLHSGIGRNVDSLSLLPISFQEALTAMGYRGAINDDDVVHYKNIRQINPRYKRQGFDQRELILRLSKAFRSNRYQEIAEQISLYFANLKPSSPHSERIAKQFALEFISTIISDSFSMGVQPETIVECSSVFTNIFSCDMHNLQLYVCKLAKQLLNGLFQKQQDYYHRLIGMAKQYIHENLSNEKLDLEMVSNHIGLSKIYFCKLFHKEEGVSFTDYLNYQRIARAKELLWNSHLKVFEISYEIGYSNPKYFHYVFKRLTGVTPLEHRNSMLHKNTSATQ
ncbi:MAG: response regulator [Clostridiales bacterium]|nr:response regulator [Clostridiales bacterium]